MESTNAVECQICNEKYNKRYRYKVECSCGESCCRDCIKKYITTKKEKLHCMFCKINWNQEFIYNNFEKVYINGEYKEHRMNILYEAEIGMFAATQPYIERQQQKQILHSEIKELTDMQRNMAEKIREKTSEIIKLCNDQTIEKKKYVCKCPNNNCQGYLSSQLKCELCNSWVCSECREIKGTTRDCHHECNKEILESVKLLTTDSKPCPKCTALIYKIEGCSQMFCTECNTAFNWNTLRIETGVIHNPHYFEWLRRNNTENTLERNPNDILCGRELDHHFITNIINKFISAYNAYALEQSRNIQNNETRQNATAPIRTNLTPNKHFKESILQSLEQYKEDPKYKITIQKLLYDIEVRNVHSADYKSEKNPFAYQSRLMQYIIQEFSKYSHIELAEFESYKKISQFQIYIITCRLENIRTIIQKTMHIMHFEIPRNTTDYISNNLLIRADFMMKKITEEDFKNTIQRRDKEIQRRTEYANVLRMYVSCITDLFYRMFDNIDLYDDILKEMHELRNYTNDCMKQVFRTFQSKMNHYISDTFTYTIGK